MTWRSPRAPTASSGSATVASSPTRARTDRLTARTPPRPPAHDGAAHDGAAHDGAAHDGAPPMAFSGPAHVAGKPDDAEPVAPLHVVGLPRHRGAGRDRFVLRQRAGVGRRELAIAARRRPRPALAAAARDDGGTPGGFAPALGRPRGPRHHVSVDGGRTPHGADTPRADPGGQ